MYRIAIIFGTRPEAIKLAPIILALRDHRAFDCSVCVTGQHRQMLDQALTAFGLVPDADLDLMSHDQTLAGLTARGVQAIDGYLEQVRPDLVLVQGDTTTAFCATLSAYYRRIAVGHVEAGLRTGNLHSPWPEEGNRVLISRLATLHFAPTETARRNLLWEGIPEERIFVTGNTAVDALLLALEKVRATPPAVPGLSSEVCDSRRGSVLILITSHRRDSFGVELESICRAIAALAEKFPAAQFVYPVHLNPNVKEAVRRILAERPSPNLHLIDPVPYLSFVALLDRATLILTDSGGIQEEAPTLGKPVLILRETTERPEGVENGTSTLVGTDFQRIVNETSRFLINSADLGSRTLSANPYGDGHAARRIVDACDAFRRSR